MLYEFALTPDVFCSGSFESEEYGRVYLQNIKEALLNEALVRDLRDGSWRECVRGLEAALHPRGKELLKKLIKQNRLRIFPPVSPAEPEDYNQWCEEAIASANEEALSGIIAGRELAEGYADNDLVGSIERLEQNVWWQTRSSSVRLDRKIDDYTHVLRPVLLQANSLMFIDRFIDPERGSYRRFLELLDPVTERDLKPAIEIHRTIYERSGSNREFKSVDFWERKFAGNWRDSMKEDGITAEVYLWDDLHDRYLISDIIGISLPNGFDVSGRPGDDTTWTRLGRQDRDDVQREFDPSAGRHTLRGMFKLG